MRSSLALLTALTIAFMACRGNDSPRASATDTTATNRDAAPAGAAPERRKQPLAKGDIWRGRSGGFDIVWRTDDITAGPSANPGLGVTFSLRELAHAEWRQGMDTAGDAEDLKGCEEEHTAKLLSAVGPLVSFERNEYSYCPGAAHPGVTTWYESIDLAHPNRPQRLTEYFEEKDILQALLADALVQKTLAREEGDEKGKTPATLDELVRRLAGVLPECEYSFDEDLLTRFAFHHVENGKVAVRIGLSDGAGACRGMLTQIGILLPIPPSLATPLDRASKGSEGFLMREMKKIAGDKSATFKLL